MTQAKSNLIAEMKSACGYYAKEPFSCNSEKETFRRKKKAKAIAFGFFRFFEKNKNSCFSVYWPVFIKTKCLRYFCTGCETIKLI